MPYNFKSKVLYEKAFEQNDFSHLSYKTIFVTGATGFLGLWLLRAIEYLNKNLFLNIKVVVLLRDLGQKKLFNDFANTNIHYIEGSITNFQFKEIKIDHIIHMAAETSPKKNKDFVEVINTIVNGTIRISNFSKFVKSRSISYLSSGGVYGKDCKNKDGWHENDNCSPKMFDQVATYGLSKKCAENIILHTFKSQKNLKTINIFRAFSFGGSYFNRNNHFAFDHFIRKRIMQENISLLSNGNSLRNYMHPLDLMCWILVSKSFSNINLINTGGKKNYSIKRLANKIAKIRFHNLPVINVLDGKKSLKENYIPNLNTAKELGLYSKISLDMQIKDSLNYYYDKKNKKKYIKGGSL